MNELPLEITCAEVKAKLDANEECLLLDCREQNEWDHVHISGATLLPMSELQDRVGELEQQPQAELIVYCHHGMRSAQVTAWLRGRGMNQVQSMAGGIDRWAVEIEPGMTRY